MPLSRQQSGLNDLQLLQQHVMFKQLQEMQRQQQLQGLSDTRQQNYVNQFSTIRKQTSGGQFPPLFNGTPIHGVARLNMVGNMNVVQRGTPQVTQGFLNEMAFSQAQNQSLLSMSSISQQPDESLYGIPVGSTKNNKNQYSHLQGASHDSSNLLAKANNSRLEKHIIQSSYSFMNNQCNAEQVCVQAFQEKNLYEQVPNQQVFNNRMLPGNFQLLNPVQKNPLIQEFVSRQEQSNSPVHLLGKPVKASVPQGFASPGPLEEKINSEGNSWEGSLGRCSNISISGLDNSLDHPDYLSSFPSIHSGSWSALMQSAVAEASSSDTGLQEEWSGVSFQYPEHSTENQHSNFGGCGKQHTSWVSDNLQSASSVTSKTEILFNNSNMSSPNLHEFQQSGRQFFSVNRREGLCSDSSHESFHQCPENPSEWAGYAQQKQQIDGSQPHQIDSSLQTNAWSGQNYEISESIAQEPSISMYYNAMNKSFAGDVDNVIHKDPDGLWKIDNGNMTGSAGRENNHLSDLETRLPGENYFLGENSFNSHHSNVSQHTMKGPAVRKNLWLHNSDGRYDAESIQQPFAQAHQGLSGHTQGYANQFRFSHNVSNGGMSLDQGDMPDIQVHFNALEELPARISNASNGLCMTTQARDHRSETQLGITYSTPLSEVLQPQTPDVSAIWSYNNSCASQCYGLKLAPQSHHPPNSNLKEKGTCTMSFPSDFTFVGNPFENSQNQPSPSVAFQFREQTLPDIASGFPAFNPSSQTNCSQHFPVLETVPATQPFLSSSWLVEFPMKPPNEWTNLPTHQQHLSDTNSLSIAPAFLLSPDTENSGIEIASGPPHELQNKNSFRGRNISLETGAYLQNSVVADHDGENSGKERSNQQISSEIQDTLSQAGSLSHAQESFENHLLEPNAIKFDLLMNDYVHQGSVIARHCDNQTSTTSTGDLEPIDDSLKKSPLIHQNYSLSHQMQHMKTVEINQDKSVLVRSLVNSELNSKSQNLSVSSENNKMGTSLDAKGNHSVEASSPAHKAITLEMAKFGENSVQRSAASNSIQHSQISLQMAPSWFEHCGSLKNGQILPVYDAKLTSNVSNHHSVKTTIEDFHMPSSMRLVNSANACQVNEAFSTAANNSVSVKHLSPSFVSSPDATCKSVAVLRTKKRKIAEFEFIPWHKELSQGYQRTRNIRAAEVEWAQATNRLIRKVKDDAEMIEDGLPTIRPKKRLILTTQLMQQVFQAAPAVFLSADASAICDSVVYFSARLALGDSCCLISNSDKAADTSDRLSEKFKGFDRIGSQDISKIVEDFIHRSEKLESDFFRLDRRASILDIVVEYQELEKFSVINRFAQYHGRGQAGASGPSSSATTPNTLRPVPQKFVTASSMPRTVPEGANCLSL